MMKLGLLLATALFGGAMASAQAPAGAPAGTNGICKDGTYSTAPSKSGACAGHKGVQTWYMASAPKTAAPAAATKSAPMAATPAKSAPATPAKSMPAPTPAPAMASKPAPAPQNLPPPAASLPAKGAKQGPAQSAASKTAKAGGGPGLVWVNTSSNVYHCNGDTYYGKTAQGAYMSEADAKAKGAHGDHGKTCAGK